MRHIIVHLVRGDAGKFHTQITQDLTRKFDSFPLHNRIPSHLTLKRWFELDEKGMGELYKTLDSFAKSHSQSDYELKGYGNFGKDVLYIDAQPSTEMRYSIKDLYESLHKIKGLTFDKFDTGDELHATVAMGALKPFDYNQIWNHLAQGKQPDFKMKFDNIAVLKKLVDKWVIDRIWEIKP